MRLKILDTKKAEKGSKELPAIFSEQVRTDLIKRAVEALQANARQPYGAAPLAGKKSSSKLSRRRRDYKGAYGHGISRSPRKILSRNGTRFNWVGAFAPNTVGGRPAHPPKTYAVLTRKINTKENRKAIRSAVAATLVNDLVKTRGHIAPAEYPFIISNEFETIAKTKKAYDALLTLGLEQELARAEEKTIRTGRSKLRGRHYRKRKSVLFVVGKECPLIKAAANIPGVETVTVNQLNAELLAPGTVPGRLTLFTESAIERLDKEKLFYNNKMNGAAPDAKPAKTSKAAKPDANVKKRQ
jgi:large subunit ribosomal protein L4e